MSGGEAAGEVPVSEPRAAGVQPTNGPGSDLGQPVPLVDVLANMAPEFARSSRSDLENLERRLADHQMLDELAARNFTGRRYQRFENELARYGMSVLRGWMHSGYIFMLTAARGFALHPSDAELEELFRDPDAREELAIMTVALALPRFREHALIRGGWRFEGGAKGSAVMRGATTRTTGGTATVLLAAKEVQPGDPTSSPPGLEKSRRIVGAQRQTLAKDLVKRYTEGESIRALASSTGRSYGFVHRVLTESGVQLRQRGGARRRKKP